MAETSNYLKSLTGQDSEGFPTGQNAGVLANFNDRQSWRKCSGALFCACIYGTYMRLPPEPKEDDIKYVWQLKGVGLIAWCPPGKH